MQIDSRSLQDGSKRSKQSGGERQERESCKVHSMHAESRAREGSVAPTANAVKIFDHVYMGAAHMTRGEHAQVKGPNKMNNQHTNGMILRESSTRRKTRGEAETSGTGGSVKSKRRRPRGQRKPSKNGNEEPWRKTSGAETSLT